MFGSDRVLLYDVSPWNRLGFGVANFGENVGTLSVPIHKLADEVGKMQLYVMTHVDAMRSQAPGRNTVERICKSTNRIKQVLTGRSTAFNEQRLEAGHFRPAPEIWNIHPVPYFPGPLVKNGWLSEYNKLCMIGLTNMYQHSDNNLELTITEKFAQDVWQYFREVVRLVASELLALPEATWSAPEFLFTSEHYANYHPEDVTINIEALDGPGNIFSLPTEDDLRPLLQGVPANMIAPSLKQYPVGPIPGLEGVSGTELPDGEETIGTGGAGGSSDGAGIGPPVV